MYLVALGDAKGIFPPRMSDGYSMTGTAASPPCRRGRLDDRRGGISFGVHEFLDGRCSRVALGLRGRLDDRRGGII